MVSFPPCKINLGLHIVAKRSDGYHDLETCFYPIQWTDILEIIPASDFKFTSSGSAIPGKTEENLCVRAYHLLRDQYDLPGVHIHLHKILPIGSGLGGGSSDAASTLTLLNQIFSLNVGIDQLRTYASQLGSDCAFFMTSIPMVGTRRGENLTPIKLSLENKFVVLVNPGIIISTQEAFGNATPQLPAVSLNSILQRPVNEWRGLLINDFEKSVFPIHPLLKEIKDKLYSAGALYASLSGSGSTLFGLFDKPIEIPAAFSTMQVWSGNLTQ